MLSGHRVHHRLIFDNVVPFVYLLFCFVAQVLIHLVTRTIVAILNIGIGTFYMMMGMIRNSVVPVDNLKKSLN